MRIVNDELDFSSLDLAQATSNTQTIWVGHVVNAAFQIVVSGAPVGTFKVQFSCDDSAIPGGTTVTNWTDLPSASVAVSGAGVYGLNLVDLGYPWMRITWTKTSGTGLITSARLNVKGV